MFTWLDYMLFSSMLMVSVLIGVYFGFFKTKQNTANEYLWGGRIMQTIPIAISVAVR
jgi:sodium-coupled monocarboxylate transporter 8/12